MKSALHVLLAIASVAGAPTAYAEGQLAESIAEKIQTGLASFYARHFEGNRTASGETFRHDSLIAAHPTFPFGTLARVTHIASGRWVDVRIMDRGPSATPQRKGVIIDLSQSAASQLDMIRAGRAHVSVEVLEWGNRSR